MIEMNRISEYYSRLMQYKGDASQKNVHLAYAAGAALGLAGMALIPGPQPLEDLLFGAITAVNTYKCRKDAQQESDHVTGDMNGCDPRKRSRKQHSYRNDD